MGTPVSTPATHVWHAPDVMNALLMRARFEGHRYPPHAHDTHCLAVITGGELHVSARGQQRVCRRGDVVLIEADTVHAGEAGPAGGWKMRVMHVEPSALARYTEEIGLPRQASVGTSSPFLADPALARGLYGVNWCSETGHDAFKRGEVLAALVTRLFNRHARRAPALSAARQEAQIVRDARRRMLDHLDGKFTLEALAEDCRVTPFVLLRAFVRHEGLTPHAFLQQARIRHGVQLLRAGFSIAEAAMRTGFSDQAHFSRVFKRLIGVSPRAFQLAVTR